MSRKISIQEKRQWLDMYEQGKTEVQIARAVRRDPRTIVKGLEEASKDRRLASAEVDMLRTALFRHQEQLTGILQNVSSMLVLPPDNLEMREEKEGVLAPVPLSGALVKHISKDQMVLEIPYEDKLEWELLLEHLKQDKLWDHLKQWRKTLIDHIWARWQFKQAVKAKLVKETEPKSLEYKDSKQSENLLRELVDLLYDVVTQRILGTLNKTDVENVIDTKLARYNNTTDSGDKIISIFTSLPHTSKASKVKRTYEDLAAITRLAKRQVEEILLLGMVTGKCRVCRRLGR